MSRILLAFRAFFRILFDGAVAPRVAAALTHEPVASPTVPPAPTPAQVKPKPTRNDALNLLAALQREARLIDFLQEPLDGYSDAQIGAAVRDVHRDAGSALRRMFELRPLTTQPEDSPIEVAAGADAVRYRLTGNVAGSPPFRGRLRHHGWEAAKCELPAWTGGSEAMTIVAPMEVEVT